MAPTPDLARAGRTVLVSAVDTATPPPPVRRESGPSRSLDLQLLHDPPAVPQWLLGQAFSLGGFVVDPIRRGLFQTFLEAAEAVDVWERLYLDDAPPVAPEACRAIADRMRACRDDFLAQACRSDEQRAIFRPFLTALAAFHTLASANGGYRLIEHMGDESD